MNPRSVIDIGENVVRFMESSSWKISFSSTYFLEAGLFSKGIFCQEMPSTLASILRTDNADGQCRWAVPMGSSDRGSSQANEDRVKVLF